MHYILDALARAEKMLDQSMRWTAPAATEGKGMLVYSPVVSRPTPELIQDLEKYSSFGKSQPKTNKFGYQSTAINHGSFTVSPEDQLNNNFAPPRSPNPKMMAMGRQLIRRRPKKYLIKHRKFEVNTLCRVYLGKFGLYIYTMLLCLYVYFALWAYVSVFSSAMAKSFPTPTGSMLNRLFEDDYLCYAIIFGTIVVPLSCLDLEEQITFQVMLTCSRLLMLTFMLTTSTSCAKDYILANNERDIGEEQKIMVEPAPLFNLSGIPKALPIIVFASIYHHSIPGLAHPVGDKTKLSPIFKATTIFCAASYWFLGVVLASAFGTSMEESANLNWKAYGASLYLNSEPGENQMTIFALKAISNFVVLFPALDVLSVFPLLAVTLGNNLMDMFFGGKADDVEVSCILIHILSCN